MQIKINNYPELRECIDTFNSGKIDILIVEGSAGSGKSSIVRQGFKDKPDNQYCWLEGRITAAAFFQKLYDNRDLPIILDDIDGLYRDKECVNLLKCLCQTEDEKTVSWNTMRQIKSGAPPEFRTKSKVCVITNCWKTLNKNVGAAQDRGLLVLFHPTAQEIHRYVKDELGHIPEIFNQEIYDFIGKNLNIISEPSIRHYRNALKLKDSKIEWRMALIQSFGLTDNQVCVMKLLEDKSLSNNQRSEIFARDMKLSPKTYWRTKSDLNDRGMQSD